MLPSFANGFCSASFSHARAHTITHTHTHTRIFFTPFLRSYLPARFIILAADGRDLHVVADSEREYNEWFLSVGEITDPETFG